MTATITAGIQVEAPNNRIAYRHEGTVSEYLSLVGQSIYQTRSSRYGNHIHGIVAKLETRELAIVTFDQLAEEMLIDA